MTSPRIAAWLLALGLSACAAQAEAIPPTPRTIDPVVGVEHRLAFGDIITADGMTVYIYTKDRPNESVCYDTCAMDWPPLLVTRTPTVTAALPGRLKTTVRKDGTKQLTYNGQPLYLYIEDPPHTDQANGQDVEHVWFVIKP